MRKGQSSNEITIIIGIMVVFLIAFLGVLGNNFTSVATDRTKVSADELADSIERVLVQAALSQDGFSARLNA